MSEVEELANERQRKAIAIYQRLTRAGCARQIKRWGRYVRESRKFRALATLQSTGEEG